MFNLFLIDINECTNGQQRCVAPAICLNGAGNYTCGCPGGYTQATTFTCEGIYKKVFLKRYFWNSSERI